MALLLLLNATINFTYCQTMNNEKFRAVTYVEAVELKAKKKGTFLKHIPFNNASVFTLSDSSFLVLPLNPFTMALIVYDTDSLDKMVKDEKFPVREQLNAFYHANMQKIAHLDVYRKELITELEQYLSGNGFVPGNSEPRADAIYTFLKEKKSLKKYQLHFIVFLANVIVRNFDGDLKVGLMKEKQTLNPIVYIVLVRQTGDNSFVFFNLEYEVFGRSGYYGIRDLMNNATRFRKTADPLNIIDKVFDWPVLD